MSSLRIQLGKRLQQFREVAKLTQEKLAQKVEIEYKYLADIEHGRKSVSLEVLERLMAALDVEPFELFSFGLRNAKGEKEATAELIGDLAKTLPPQARNLALRLLQNVARQQHPKG
jgi:transcriptional regulator with XRE-family HTH domain